MVLKSSAARTGGQILRLKKIRNHQRVMRVNSFFEGSTLTFPDNVCLYKKLPWQADPTTVLQICRDCLRFKSSQLWVLHERNLHRAFPSEYKDEKLTGTVEIDEALFGKEQSFIEEIHMVEWRYMHESVIKVKNNFLYYKKMLLYFSCNSKNSL